MKRITPAILLVSLVGCDSNPFKGVNVSNAPEQNRYEVRPALGIDAPDVMRFEEGKSAEYRIGVKVPEGEPVVTFEDIPDGVTYNAAEGTLGWTPSYEQGNDPSNRSIKTREYQMTMILSSSVDRATAIRKSLLLQVTDTARPLVVAGLAASYSMKEGESKTLATLDVTAEDFPATEMRAELKDTSLGMKLVRVNNSAQWTLKAEYGVDQLKVGGNCSGYYSCSVNIENTLILTAPDGRQQKQDFKISLEDQRQDPRTSLATSLVVKGDMTYAFTVSDGNKEIAPRVNVLSSPNVGVFTVRQVSAVGVDSNYEISWTDVPPDAVGQTFTASFDLCTSSYGYSLNTNRCKRQDVSLKVEERTVASPSIARGDWSQDKIKYLQNGKKLDFTVTVSAGRDNLRLLSTTASSSDAADQVTLSNSRLSITSTTPGLKTVTVNAVNSVGGVANAVFLYEVLPANWSENVILASSASAPEFATIEALWGKATRSYQAGQNLNARTLAFRKSITVGTHSMGLPDAGIDLSFFATNMKKILITTPLLASLPADIISELRGKGLRLGGRASAVPNFNLADFELDVVRSLGTATEVVKLKGTTSGESSNPALISLSATNTECKALFSLIKAGPITEEYVVGAACPLSGGRTAIVLGFEWSDLQFAEADAALNQQWFERIWE